MVYPFSLWLSPYRKFLHLLLIAIFSQVSITTHNIMMWLLIGKQKPVLQQERTVLFPPHV